MDIEHITVFMLENHSFNRMLGVVPGVDGVVPFTRDPIPIAVTSPSSKAPVPPRAL